MDYLLIFIEGIASFISPCMLPMLPIYISYFAGDKDKKTYETIINSCGFVLGFTIVFVLLAMLANTVGTIVAPIIRYLKIFFGILIIFLGLNYMEIIKIKVLNRSATLNRKMNNINFLKAICFGMLFSVSWTPCVGAFLSSALLLIASESNLIKGITLVLLYSLGLGMPFIISAFLIDKLKSTFDFIKKHYDVVKKISGIVLIIMGIYIMF